MLHRFPVSAVFKREAEVHRQKSSHLDTTVQRLQALVKSPPSRASNGASDWSKLDQREQAIIGGRTAKVVLPKLSPDLKIGGGAYVREIGRIKTVKVKSELLSDSEIVDISSIDDRSASTSSKATQKRRKKTSRKLPTEQSHVTNERDESRIGSPAMSFDLNTEGLSTFQQLEVSTEHKHFLRFILFTP